MIGYRAVLKNPPADMLGVPTISSWRKARESAEEAGEVFLVASGNRGEIVIEEKVVDLFVVVGYDRKYRSDYEHQVLLPFGEVYPYVTIAVAELLGHSHFTVKRINSTPLTNGH